MGLINQQKQMKPVRLNIFAVPFIAILIFAFISITKATNQPTLDNGKVNNLTELLIKLTKLFMCSNRLNIICMSKLNEL